jgi:hypothetical protein
VSEEGEANEEGGVEIEGVISWGMMRVVVWGEEVGRGGGEARVPTGGETKLEEKNRKEKQESKTADQTRPWLFVMPWEEGWCRAGVNKMTVVLGSGNDGKKKEKNV